MRTDLAAQSRAWGHACPERLLSLPRVASQARCSRITILEAVFLEEYTEQAIGCDGNDKQQAPDRANRKHAGKFDLMLLKNLYFCGTEARINCARRIFSRTSRIDLALDESPIEFYALRIEKTFKVSLRIFGTPLATLMNSRCP